MDFLQDVFEGRNLRYWEVWAGGVRLVKEMVEGLGCQRHPAGVGMPLASRSPLGQLREIAAEKETTC